jgi:hypothetical protein
MKPMNSFRTVVLELAVSQKIESSPEAPASFDSTVCAYAFLESLLSERPV